MKSYTPYRLWALILGLPLACAGAGEDLGVPSLERPVDGAPAGTFGGAALDTPASSSTTFAATSVQFPGGGTSGAARPLSAALPPASSGLCDPEPVQTDPPSIADVQTVCFYGAEEPDVPAAIIEQVVEVVGNTQWVHMRLTLNPAFVDNTYGETAIGWADDTAGDEDAQRRAGADAGVAPPAPPSAPEAGASAEPLGDAGAPPPRPPRGDDARPDAPRGRDAAPRERPEPARGAEQPGRGRGRGHTFNDLLRSDHAEIQLLDATGNVAMHFALDYLSASPAAPSGYASLGVSGGEGALTAGEPEWVLATTTSLDRNLNGCGLGGFIESSPATDAAYTPNADATDWDYRVAYEIWVSTEAFGAAGFGSALIENVHASPSKLAGDTVDVSPGPCPVDPNQPEAEPAPLPPVLDAIR